MISSLQIPKHIFLQIIDHLHRNLPNEACGLLAGLNSQVMEWFPISNIYNSPTRYRLHPQQQLDAFLTLESKGMELLAIVHSHPSGPSTPSQTDIDEAYYPEAVYIIGVPENHHWRLNGYQIQNKQVFMVKIILNE